MQLTKCLLCFLLAHFGCSNRQPDSPSRDPKAAPSASFAIDRSLALDAAELAVDPPLENAAQAEKLARDVERAKQLVDEGLEAYRQGDYTLASRLLSEAIAIYPFLPKANLALGKIFLIQGSANRDQLMINNARLMFEMAHALDPTLREPETLLKLFVATDVE